MKTWGIRVMVLLLLFVFALAGGIWLAGDYRVRQQVAQEERIAQQQVYERQTEALRRQEESLRKERQRLEEERRAFEREKRDLEASAARAEGRNEQMDEDRKDTSEVGRIWDQVTGKEEERRKAQQENEAIREQARRGAQEIQKSIEQAGKMIADLNERMQELERMKEQVKEMQETAEKVYEGNQEAIEKLLSYLVVGAAWLKEHW